MRLIDSVPCSRWILFLTPDCSDASDFDGEFMHWLSRKYELPRRARLPDGQTMGTHRD
jgi:hypothetical protein